MKLNRFFSAVLSAVLLISLCACNFEGENGPPSTPRVSRRPPSSSSRVPEHPDTSETPPEGSATPDPIPTPTTPYDRDHRLDAAVPPLIDGLELPVIGATGYTSVALPLRSSNPNWSAQTAEVTVWAPGTAFLILEEDGGWWRVSRDNVTGWIEHRYCMINLPDVIPSIIYDDANAYSSRFITSGKDIPGVTGETFYHSLVYNVRLNRSEFVMPILYSAARNICTAQHKALAEGNCLVIYQTFRPYNTQISVANAVKKLAQIDDEVKAGISTSPWSIDWFIATGVSNHQRGYALDVSMVKVYAAETRYVGSYAYLYVPHPTGVSGDYLPYYEEYQMPTVMHELSMAAVSTISPSSNQLSPTMEVNEPAKALRGYFLSSGFTPLASEWWHFNDLAAMNATSANPSDGKYDATECLSYAPELASHL